jgi:hypothetical protein
MPSDITPWIPALASLGGVLIGSVASLYGSMIGQWMGLKREREAREHEAERSRMRVWNEFQLKTLMELQDALDKMIRSGFRVANVSGQVAHGKMTMEQAIKCEAAFHVVRNQTLKLTVRVEDEQVRALSGNLCTLAEQMKQLGIKFVDRKTYDVSELNSIYADARRQFAGANEKIGDIIRGSQRPG